MVKLVDHDVVEVLRREPLEMLSAAERLHRSAEHVDFSVAAASHVVADTGARPDAHERRRCLGEDLFAMGHKQNATGTELGGIERSEPGLP